jgi:hypothetical protein
MLASNANPFAHTDAYQDQLWKVTVHCRQRDQFQYNHPEQGIEYVVSSDHGEYLRGAHWPLHRPLVELHPGRWEKVSSRGRGARARPL